LALSKHDDVEVWIGLDQANQLGELGDGRGGDGVDRRVVEGDPPVTGATAIHLQMRPSRGLRYGSSTAARAAVSIAHGNASICLPDVNAYASPPSSEVFMTATQAYAETAISREN
jgi:hypothetical protein